MALCTSNSIDSERRKIMVTVSKEYRAMDIADVEEAVSRMVCRKVTVGEMDVHLMTMS